MKTFSIKTLGCKVNQCDSQEIRDRFLASGWQEACAQDEPDLLVVNTCCVTHRADGKSRNAVKEAARRAAGGRTRVAVTGCYTSYDKHVIEKVSGVSAVFENSERDRLFEWAQESFEPGGSAQAARPTLTSFQEVPPQAGIGVFSGRTRAFLKIQDGCDNRCSYCIVPFVRGPSRSKGWDRVLREAKDLVEAGHKEIVLSGVNLGSFGKDLEKRADIVDVIEALEPLEHLDRIRLSSIEAADISERLIAKMASSRKLCPHLHIPFQSGDDAVLRDMHKTLGVKDYKNIVDKAREKIKDLAITCDLIVGFPTEIEDSFKNTMEFLAFAAPLRTHIFTFSERRGVAIAARKSVVPHATVKDRFNALKQLSDELSSGFRQRYVGKELDVLFEEKAGEWWQGHSENYIKIFLSASSTASPSGIDLRNTIREVSVSGLREDGVYAAEKSLDRALFS